MAISYEKLKIISRKAARKAKETFLENYGENNVSLKFSNVKDTKDIEYFKFENITEINYSSEDKIHFVTVRMEKVNIYNKP